MSVKVAKIIRTVLLVIASMACIAGVSLSQEAAKKAATDITKINVQISEKISYHEDNVGAYIYGCDYVKFTYKITNNTKVDWCYLEITTYVYDKKGESLGTITSKFGKNYGSSDFRLKVGETMTKYSTFEENANNAGKFFVTLYESNLSELEFKSEVTYGSYYE